MEGEGFRREPVNIQGSSLVENDPDQIIEVNDRHALPILPLVDLPLDPEEVQKLHLHQMQMTREKELAMTCTWRSICEHGKIRQSRISDVIRMEILYFKYVH